MDYSAFPNAPTPTDTSSPSNKVDTNNIFGSGVLASGSRFNLGGPSGVSIDGTQGIFAGADTFAAAPFSVDLQGNVVANNLSLTGVVTTGGAAADINSHATTVDGGKITGATITNSQIAGGTVTGANISSSTITGGNIAATTITAGNMNVSTLSAISANLGTITAGTVTGATLQTASSGQRVIIDSTNQIRLFDGSGSVGNIYGSGGFLILDASLTGTVTTFGDLTVVTSGGAGVHIALGGNTNVTGNLSVTGTKPFDIEHPTRDGYRLRYVAPEAPEVLVMCRGTGEVSYPQHFVDVSEPGTDQVVRDRESGNWFATAIRRGYNDFVPEYEGESAADWPGK